MSFPGISVQVLPERPPAIQGVSTARTAFIGRTLRGPTDSPCQVTSFGEFERLYGGLWAESTLGYAVQHFFLNGGSEALIARIHHGAATASATAPGDLGLAALNEGAWGNGLRVRTDLDVRPYEAGQRSGTLFNLWIKDLASGTVEIFRNVSTVPEQAFFVGEVLAQQSRLVRATSVPATITAASAAAPGADIYIDASATAFAGGTDGDAITDQDISDPGLQPDRGLWLLEKADLFNILCIPPFKRTGGDVGKATWDAAIAYARSRRAFVIVDAAEAWKTAGDAVNMASGGQPIVTRSDNAALYFPRLIASDPLRQGAPASFAPCGAVAGIFARVPVWKSPVGTHAALQGVSGLSLGGAPGALTNAEQGQINSMGINCLRAIPGAGTVVWGARTLAGADMLGSEWKYINVRRLAYFIEESIDRGTQWVVFEPIDDALRARIRLEVENFLHPLFLAGAFAGNRPDEAYFVRCDASTTSQADIEDGIIRILVGFAPLKPAEFVLLQICQKAQ